MQSIIEISQKTAYQTVNTLLVQRNWLIGYRISAEEISENNRAEYGTKVIAELSAELTQKYGKGFTKTNLYSFYSFYKKYPQIFHTACGKSHPLGLRFLLLLKREMQTMEIKSNRHRCQNYSALVEEQNLARVCSL